MKNDHIDFNKEVTLFLATEGRTTINKNLYRNYQEELLLCIKSWRNIYKKNKIILIQPHPFDLNEEVISFIEQNKNIIYIKDSTLYTDDITCGFDMKAISANLLNTKYKHLIETKYVLNIDLDMYLIKPFKIKHEDLIIGRYSNNDEVYKLNKLNEGIIYKNILPFDTGFILADISSSSSQFLTRWYLDIKAIRETIQTNKTSTQSFITEYIDSKKDLSLDLQIDSIEEWLVSWYFYNKVFNIVPIVDYQYGEFYPNYCEEDSNFFHYHWYPKDRKEFKQNYWKDNMYEYILKKQLSNRRKHVAII